MMEKREKFQDIKGRPHLSVKQFAMFLILASAVALNILFDYVTAKFDPAIYQSAAYWLRLLTTNAAVIIIMFSVRGYMKERELTQNKDILQAQKDINDAHVELNSRKLCTAFEDYVNSDNHARKLKAYRNKLQLARSKCQDGKRGKRRREKLTALLSSAEEDVEFVRVRYNKVRIGTIFSNAQIQGDDDEDQEDNEARAAARLLLKKLFGVVGFGILAASIAFENLQFAPAIIMTTIIKMFQTAYAGFVGGMDGTTFARGTLLTKRRARLDYVQKFLEKRKRGEAEKQNDKEMDQAADKEEAVTHL